MVEAMPGPGHEWSRTIFVGGTGPTNSTKEVFCTEYFEMRDNTSRDEPPTGKSQPTEGTGTRPRSGTATDTGKSPRGRSTNAREELKRQRGTRK